MVGLFSHTIAHYTSIHFFSRLKIYLADISDTEGGIHLDNKIENCIPTSDKLDLALIVDIIIIPPPEKKSCFIKTTNLNDILYFTSTQNLL